GLMSYKPNHEGAAWFVREVLPRVRQALPGTVLSIVGGGAPESIRALESEAVHVHGYAREVAPHYLGSDVMVVPLLSGGGSRLKILESFAAGLPVVSTAKGAEGLDVESGRHLLIADTPADIAAAVTRVLTDEELHDRVVREALDLASNRYDWSILAAKLEFCLQGAAAPGSPAPVSEGAPA
ncbi:MAG: glycosyltransferase family 4 protein, partial [Pseudomonadota bacterium]